jgi:transcription elongation factor Elf1
MDNISLLLGVVETVLGKGRRTSGNNFAFSCPVCNHRKPKLEINLASEDYNCWTCSPPTKGKSLYSLFKKLNVSNDKLKELSLYSKFKTKGETQSNEVIPDVKLPDEFKSLQGNITAIVGKHAKHYANSRGISDDEIYKYNVGYCERGRYANSIIIPSYDSYGKLNYFISRSFAEDAFRKYDAPRCNKNELVGFEYLINWKVPVILCEGAFDAIAIKRNAVPLFGKSLSKALILKLVQLEVNTVYIALDNDAMKDALRHCETLLNMGKEVYLVELEGTDPSDMGFEEFTKQLHSAEPLSISKLLMKKLKLNDRV